MERKGVLSPSLFNFIVSCSTNLTGRCLNLYITHLHSSFYQLSTHSQAHRCICSCPVCSHSAVHTHRCLAENIHPFLSGRNQNKSHFPNQPNPSCSSGNACSRRTRALADKQSRYSSRHHKYKRTPYYQTLKGLLLQLLATGTKGAYSRQKQKKWSLVKTSLYCILIC